MSALLCPDCQTPLVSPLKSLVFSTGKYSPLRYACACGWSGTKPHHSTPESTGEPLLTTADVQRYIRHEVAIQLAKETRKPSGGSGVNRLPRFFGVGPEGNDR